MANIVCDLALQPDPYPLGFPVANPGCALLLTLASAYEHARR